MATTPTTHDLSQNRLRLLDAVNRKLNTNFTHADLDSNFEFSNPIRMSGTNPIKNTKIKMIPRLTSKYYGVKILFYNRIHQSKLGLLEVTRTTENTLQELLPQINENYGLYINNYDIIDRDLEINEVGTFSITLQFNPTSLIFYDGSFITTPDDNPNPIIPPTGTLLNYVCDNFNKMGVYANGIGGTYLQLIEQNSPFCGYDPLEPLQIILNGGTSNTDYSNLGSIAGGGGSDPII